MSRIHRALLRGNRVGALATLRATAAAGRIVATGDDRAAGYRASGEVLARLGFGHVHEGPGVWSGQRLRGGESRGLSTARASTRAAHDETGRSSSAAAASIFFFSVGVILTAITTVLPSFSTMTHHQSLFTTIVGHGMTYGRSDDARQGEPT